MIQIQMIGTDIKVASGTDANGNEIKVFIAEDLQSGISVGVFIPAEGVSELRAAFSEITIPTAIEVPTMHIPRGKR